MRSIKYIVIILSFVLTGCVTGTRSLENLQVPEYNNDKTATGEIYIGQISDMRKFQPKPNNPSTPSVKDDLSKLSKEDLSTLIGRQRNAYGRAMGDVALPEGVKVQDKVRDLIKEGLESRGYTVVENKNAEKHISVNIDKFWAWFSPGFASVSFESNLQCKINMEHSSETQTFDVKGYGINKGQVASNANWELAFKRAFQNFLENFDAALDEKNL